MQFHEYLNRTNERQQMTCKTISLIQKSCCSNNNDVITQFSYINCMNSIGTIVPDFRRTYTARTKVSFTLCETNDAYNHHSTLDDLIQFRHFVRSVLWTNSEPRQHRLTLMCVFRNMSRGLLSRACRCRQSWEHNPGHVMLLQWRSSGYTYSSGFHMMSRWLGNYNCFTSGSRLLVVGSGVVEHFPGRICHANCLLTTTC